MRVSVATDIGSQRRPPLLGDWWRFQRDRLGFLTACHRRYGQTVRLRIVRSTFLINHPEDIHHVLVAHASNYEKSWQTTGRAGRRMFGFGLLTRQGQTHTRQRRLVQPTFHKEGVAAFVDAIEGQVERMVARWDASTTVNLTEEMDRLAEDVLIDALLGELEPEVRSRLSQTNRTRRRLINDAFGAPLPLHLPTPRKWALRRAQGEQRRILLDLVRRAADGAIGRPTLLAQMAAAEARNADRLSEADLLDELTELLTAGFETTRDALIWASYLLAAKPREAARVRDEVAAVVGSGAFRAADVPRLEYTAMFFSEALRLFPPVWMFVRAAIEDDLLPSGVRVPSRSKIFMCQYTAHRNESFFADPERFDPERFRLDAHHARPRFSYFPFGGGTRVCVAESLARLEGVLVLASLARRFDLALCPGQRVEPVGEITLRPRRPIRLDVRPRAQVGMESDRAASG